MPIIDNLLANKIVDFITPRPTVPIELENSIVETQKNYYIEKILGKFIPDDKIELFKNKLKHNFYQSLIHPGETVGIIAGQCIGEKTTQSSLNNFHSAGLDTGTTSQIDSLQNIINASKVKKKETRKYFRVCLFFHKNFLDQHSSPKNIKSKISQMFEPVKWKELVLSFSMTVTDLPTEISNWNKENTCVFNLCLEKIYTYRITRNQLLNFFQEEYCWCEYYSCLKEDATTIQLYVVKNSQLFKLKDKIIVGQEGVNSHMFAKTDKGEWYIECLCSNIDLFFPFCDVFDIKRTICGSVFITYTNFGILAAKKLIINKCEEIMGGINSAHFKILATRMTKTGFIEPLTRYTMRNSSSPFLRASFEESFETLIKACKYKEMENSFSVSSAIICGKKPRVGTNQSDILIDPSKYFTENYSIDEED